MMNAVRTTFLLAALTFLFMAVGYVVGGQFGMFLALGVAIVTNLFAYLELGQDGPEHAAGAPARPAQRRRAL